jgi:hypothetical protein
MAYKNIPNRPGWQFKDDPTDPGFDRSPLHNKQTGGVRTTGLTQVYAETKKSTDPDGTNRGEITASFYNKGVKPASFFSSLPAVGGGGGAGINPDFANVSLLVKTSSGTPVDATGNFPTISNEGFAVVDASQTKFQANSFNYTGGGYTRIIWPNASDKSLFEFGTGEFTIECWVYRTANGTEGGNGPPVRDAVFSTFRNGDGGFAFFIRQDTGRFEWKTDQGTFLLGTEVVPSNQWTHLAVSRDASHFSFTSQEMIPPIPTSDSLDMLKTLESPRVKAFTLRHSRHPLLNSQRVNYVIIYRLINRIKEHSHDSH